MVPQTPAEPLVPLDHGTGSTSLTLSDGRRMVHMSEFSSVLRSWRDRVGPAEVGMPAGPGRRTAGLRREELAHSRA
jgi:hypothetical protein